MKLVNMLDGNGNIISKIKLQSLTTALQPSATDFVGGMSGAMYFNSDNGNPMFYNGTEWVPVVRIVGTPGQTTVTYTGNPVSAVVSLAANLSATFMPTSGGTFTAGITGVGANFTSITATNFYGSLTGTATSALSAGQATHLAASKNFSIAGADVSAAAVAFDGTGNVVLVGDLKPTGVSAGSYGTNVMIPNFIVDAKGRITSATQQALSISGANGGTVKSVGVSSTTLTVESSPVTISGTISVNLTSAVTAGTATKVTYDQYGRVTAGTSLTSADIPTLSNIYVPIPGGTMTGGLIAPTATFTSGINVTTDGFGISLFSGAKVYKKAGTGVVVKMATGDIRPQVENAAGTIVGTIWDSGNLVGEQTGHSHKGQFSGTSGISYTSATGVFGLTPAGSAGTYVKVVTDVYGRVTSGGPMVASDVPDISTTYVTNVRINQAAGVAGLDGNKKIYTSALPDSILGQLHYVGVWNAATNTPALPLASATNTSGSYYIVQTGGNTVPTDLSTQSRAFIALTSATTGVWSVGDWIVSNGTTWDKVDNTDSISTWNGRVGAVVPTAGDYTATQITNTAGGTITATNVQAAINELGTEKVAKDGDTMTGLLTNTVGITAPSISATTFKSTGFGGGRALISVGTTISESTVTSTEIGWLSGTSANIQEQLNDKLGGNLANVDDRFIPMWSSATNGFENSTASVIGADRGVVAATDKLSTAADDEHGPGLGVNIGYQAGTSAQARGFRINTGLQNEVRLWQGTWYNPISWIKTLEVTSAGELSLPVTMAGATSGLAGVTSAGTFVRYTLTSADLPIASMSGMYVPISGGTMTGTLKTPALSAIDLSATTIRSGSKVMANEKSTTISAGYLELNTAWQGNDASSNRFIINGNSNTINLNSQSQIFSMNGGMTPIEFVRYAESNKMLVLGNAGISNLYLTTSGNGSMFLNTGAYNITATTVSINSNVTTHTGSVQASAFKVTGGTSAQFLKGDGSLDSNTYLTTALAAGKYLPLSGGTMTGGITFAENGTSAGYGISGQMAGSDMWRIVGGGLSDNGYLEIATADNGTEPIYVRQYNTGAFATSAIARTLTLLDASGNTILPGTLSITATPSTAGTYSGTLKIDSTGLIYKDTSEVDHKRVTSAAFVIPTGASSLSATHNLGYKYVSVKCFDNTSKQIVFLEPDYVSSTTNVLVIPTISSTLMTTTLILES